ncbi:MAG TPA: transglutaminase domain-containing protein [Gaiella sp.]
MRSVVAALVPGLAIAVAWGRMEDPVDVAAVALALAIGLVPAAFSNRVVLGVLAAGAAIAGVSVAFRVWPTSLIPGAQSSWLGDVWGQVQDGLRGFDVVVPPFDPSARASMHALVLLAVTGFTLAVSVSVAARLPLLAAGVTVVAGAWALMSVPGRDGMGPGAVLLGAALWPLVVLRARSARELAAAVLAAAAVVAVGVGAAGAGAAPDRERLDWRNWSLFGPARERVSVRYVWDATYDGIAFPSRATTLLRIRAPRRQTYWRATTLDLFTDDRWLENLYPIAVSEPSRLLPDDPLLPPAARDETGWVKQSVEVVGLDDDHVVGATQPVAVQSGALPSMFFLSGGVMRSPQGFRKGERYTVWSYAPRPIPRELLRSRADYPPNALRYLDLERTRLPVFGVSGRSRFVESLFSEDRFRPMWTYRPLWTAARRLTEGLDSPYEATLAVERWLRAAGGFRYEEQPPSSLTLPPLVDFVTRTRAGYCQHYAGAMALMLRFIGIPARVAVGFTSGTWKSDEWTVTDHDAHAWVEAWFEGYGWLAFDPTPGRGTLSAAYTLASDSADAVRSLGRGELLAIGPVDLGGTQLGTPSGADTSGESGRRSPWPILLPLLAAVAALVALAAGKALVRRLRYLTGDPRKQARAAARELHDVLRDQDVAVARESGLGELRRATERGLGVSAAAFTEAAARARYGPPARAATAAREARRELRTLRALARERLSPRDRLRGALSLRSLRRA